MIDLRRLSTLQLVLYVERYELQPFFTRWLKAPLAFAAYRELRRRQRVMVDFGLEDEPGHRAAGAEGWN